MIPEQSQHPMIQDLMRRLDADHIVPAQRRLQSFDVVELLETSTDVSNRHLIDVMCADSYIHPNGFYKISFPRSHDFPIRVRLHVWLRDAFAGQEPDAFVGQEPDAHNHKWSFASKVLTGKVTHDVLNVKPGRGNYHHYKYTRVAHGHQYAHSGTAELQLRRVESAPKGIIYSMDSRTVHRVRPDESDCTATLVVELAPARTRTDVFVANGSKPQGVTVATEHLKTDQILATLNEVLDRIKGKC